jgi:hypothetical protein
MREENKMGSQYTVTLNDGEQIGWRQGCVVCWDGTDKFEPFGEFKDHDGDDNIICLCCLMAGPDEIAARLEKKAQDLDGWAAGLRLAATRTWVIPSVEECEAIDEATTRKPQPRLRAV